MSNGNSFILDRLNAAFSKIDQFETISGPPPRQSVREAVGRLRDEVAASGERTGPRMPPTVRFQQPDRLLVRVQFPRGEHPHMRPLTDGVAGSVAGLQHKWLFAARQ